MAKKHELEAVSIRLLKETPLLSDTPITTPMDAVELLGKELCAYDREVVCVINLCTDGKPINYNIVSVGSLSQSVLHPREMLKSSILSNAASMILMHNHPSGRLIPSKDDTVITDKMLKVCDMIGIPMLDHIIVGGDNKSYFSFKAENLLEFESPKYETDYRCLDNKRFAVAEAQTELSTKDACPYCQIKAVADTKTIFEALNPTDGQCHDCGAYIDAGQHVVKVNGYADIYKGAVRLMGELAYQFKSILSFYDINLNDYVDDEDEITLSVHTSEIIKQLFAPYVGGTTVCNFKKALGIKKDEVAWILSGKDEENE